MSTVAAAAAKIIQLDVKAQSAQSRVIFVLYATRKIKALLLFFFSSVVHTAANISQGKLFLRFNVTRALALLLLLLVVGRPSLLIKLFTLLDEANASAEAVAAAKGGED